MWPRDGDYTYSCWIVFCELECHTLQIRTEKIVNIAEISKRDRNILFDTWDEWYIANGNLGQGIVCHTTRHEDTYWRGDING